MVGIVWQNSRFVGFSFVSVEERQCSFLSSKLTSERVVLMRSSG